MNGFPQVSGDILVNQERSEFQRRPLSGVRQDNSAPLRYRVASGQAYPPATIMRSQSERGDSDRSRKHSTRRRTVPATTWLKKPISSEIDRIAKDSGQTRSKTIAVLLEEAVHQKLHIQHAILLGPIIEDALAREREKDRRRTATLLVQNTAVTRQVKYLLTHLLGRTGSRERVTAQELERILDWSKRKAREGLVGRGQHTEALIEAIGEWLDAEGKEETPQGG